MYNKRYYFTLFYTSCDL